MAWLAFVSRKLLAPLSAEPIRVLIFLGTVFYVGLFAFNNITRAGHFSPDGMNYVNVARNILAGKGITQPTLGFNQSNFSIEEKIPTPMTGQAPLYPVLIALFSRTGLSLAGTALLVPAVAYAVIFLVVYKLAGQLYGDKVALAAIGILSAYWPLRVLTKYALNDVVGIAFVFISCWLLVKQSGDRKAWLLVSAGLAAGLAFATRYALLPISGIGGLFLLASSEGWKRKVVDSCLYGAGFAVPAGLVWTHNFLAGKSVMAGPGVGRHNLLQTISETGILFQRLVDPSHPYLQAAFLALSVLGFGGILIAKHQFFATTRDVFFSRKSCILIFWSAGYLIFLILVISRSQMGFDTRFVVPVGASVIMFWAALAVRAINPPLVLIKVCVLALLVLVISQQALVTKQSYPFDLQRKIARSERLSWVARYTTDQDLIFGDDTVDIPFYLKRPFTVSFSGFVYTMPATYEKVVAYAQRHCREYRNIYLVLRRYPDNEEQWRYLFGDFFADLRFGHLENYPDIILVRYLRDGSIFQVVCL